MTRNKIVVGFKESRDRWLVLLNGEVRSQHKKKQQAEKEGRRAAKGNKPSKFVVQRKSGGVSYNQFYGESDSGGLL